MLADNWGATQYERAVRRPCDALVSADAVRAHRAISIAAPVATVFRWLCQFRVAPYSYDLIDNLGRRSPRELTPGVDALEPGQRFLIVFRLHSFVRDEHLTLVSGRRVAVTYAVAPGPDGGMRLVATLAADVPGPLQAPLLAGDLVMMRKQLRTIRDLAEGPSGSIDP